MRRKPSLRMLLSVVFGGLMLLSAGMILFVVAGAGGEAAFDDAIDKGRQAQRVLSERVGAEFAKVERAARLLASLPEGGADAEAVFSLVPAASARPAGDAPAGWSMREGRPTFRVAGEPLAAVLDPGELTAIMGAFMQEGVSGVLLAERAIIARTVSGGRVDLPSDEALAPLFFVATDDFPPEAPNLRRIWRADDEPILLSSEPLATDGLDLRVGFATTPSTVGESIGQVVLASVIAGIIGLLAVAAALWIAKRIAGAIGGLRDALGHIADLDLDAVEPIPEKPARELEDIRHGLDRAVRSLRAYSLFVPRRLVKRLLSQGDGSLRLAEECEVSVLFTDIVGFTTMARDRRPAEVTALLDSHFALVAGAVEAEGGTLDKYVGDGCIAYWGAPEPMPDHATRALHAAMRIRREHLAARERGEIGFAIRIGVHSGPAVAGTVGAGSRLDYTVVGDTVNVASRLEQLGREVDPDDGCCTLVSADTCGVVDAHGCRSIGRRALRGRNGEVEVFRLA